MSSVQMKYKTEIGESMVQPSKKLKKILLVVGVTGAVYVCFKYLLPLVIPFLLAYGIALAFYPSAGWIARRCRVQVRGKYYGIPIGIIGAVEFLLFLMLVAVGLYLGSKKLRAETGMLMDHIPLWFDGLDQWLTAVCHKLELVFCLQENYMISLVRDMLRGLSASIKSKAMSYLMMNSMLIVRCCIQCTIVCVVLLIGVVLSLQEMEDWKEKRERSMFQKEFAMLSKRLCVVGNAFLKTQGAIMLLTMTICTIGFWILKNPYYIIAGIGVGLFDALPVFGLGAVLIPWALFSFVQGNIGRGLALFLIYIICYFIREVLEAKMMGDKVGLSPLETLISMYVGLQLFGLLGFILGPIGLLLIEDIVKSVEL